MTGRELSLCVVLRVERDGGEAHVEGVVAAPDGTERPFAGWMALLDALEGVVEDDLEARS